MEKRKPMLMHIKAGEHHLIVQPITNRSPGVVAIFYGDTANGGAGPHAETMALIALQALQAALEEGAFPGLSVE